MIKQNIQKEISGLQSIIALLTGVYIFSIFLYGSNTRTLYITDITFVVLIIPQIIYLMKKNFKINKIVLINLPFLAVLLMGSLYSSNINSSLSLFRTYLILYLFMILLLVNLDSEKIIRRIVKYISFASFVMSLYVTNFYGFERIINAITMGRRIGYEISQPNTIGHYAAIGFIISIYTYLDDSRIKSRIASILISLTTLTVILASLSRKALLLAVIGALIVYLSKKSFKAVRIIMVFLGIFIVYNLLSLIPDLNPFFERLNSMFSLVFGSGIESNQSDLIRRHLIEEGIRMFKNRLFIGHGTGEFRYLAVSSFGMEVASHNNYIELAVNNGILGLLTYYIPYIYLLRYYLKKIIPNNNSLGVVLFSLLVTDLIISGMTLFTYINKISMMIFILSLSYMIIHKKEKR